MGHFIRNLAAVLVCLVSFALTVALVLGIEHVIDLNIFTFMWWGVIPAGAIAVGCLAASGYYLGAMKLNVRPKGLAGLAFFVVIALVQVALYYAPYAMTKTQDGQAISELVSFPRFVGWSLSHAKYSLSVHGYHPGGPDSGFDVGYFGYVIALVQLLGLMVGAAVVYFVLADKPYCESCAKYLKQTAKLQLPFAGDINTVNELRQVPAPSSAYFNAVAQLPPGMGAALELELSTCPECAREALQERPMFVKDGKLAYQGGAYRTLWSNTGESSAQYLAALPIAAANATMATSPPPPAL